MAIRSINPATGELLREFTPLTAPEIEIRLAAAVRGFEAYCKTSFGQRAVWLWAAADVLDRDRERYAHIMTLEMGKPLAAARAEAEKCARACRFYAEHGERFLSDEAADTLAGAPPGARVRYQPLGVVLAVMPWNFPFWQLFRCAVPALMAGNTVVLKHASNVPQCALAIETVFREAGFPADVFQTLLIGAGQVAPLIADARVAAVSLTGSEAAGVEVGVAAARHIKKVVLELGGSDPFIVMPSADLEASVAAAVTARIQNNGQSCIAAKRFILADPIAAAFTKRFVDRLQGLRVGDPMSPETDLGPLSSPDAVRGLHQAVQASGAAGARCLLGGQPLPGPGCFYPATVLTDIPRDCPAYRDELFGPVACLFTVADAAAAVRIANDTRFGLGASVWTRDPDEQRCFADEIAAGMVFFNRIVASDPALPFGGIKASGHGRELGALGIREFTNPKTLLFGQ